MTDKSLIKKIADFKACHGHLPTHILVSPRELKQFSQAFYAKESRQEAKLAPEDRPSISTFMVEGASIDFLAVDQRGFANGPLKLPMAMSFKEKK